jgi:hypothetical protein
VTFSIIRSLTWEYVRLIAVLLPATVALIVGGPWAFLGLIQLQGLTMDEAAFRPYQMLAPFLGLGTFAWITIGLLPNSNWRPRIYTMPVSTRLLVTWQMAIGMLLVAIVNPLTMWLYCVSFGSEWPFLGPTLFQMSAMSVACCFTWYLAIPNTGSGVRYALSVFRNLGAIIVIVAAGVFWLDARYKPPAGSKLEYAAWDAITLGEAATMLAVVVVAWLMAMRGAMRHRHSDLAELPDFDATSVTDEPESKDFGPAWLNRFRMAHRLRDADHALSCLHWQDGLILAIVLAFGWGIILLGALIALFGSNDHRNKVEGALVFLTMFPVMGGLMIGSVLGSETWEKQRRGMRTFTAVTPVSDARLARSYLLNTVKTSSVFWVMLVTAAVVVLLIGLWRSGTGALVSDFQNLKHPRELGVWWLPLFLLLSYLSTWTAAGLTASLTWTGRDWLVGLVVTIVFSLMFFVPVTIETLIPPESRDAAQHVILHAGGILIAVLTLVAFHVAIRMRVINGRSAWFAVAAWTIESALLWCFLPVAAIYRLAWTGVLACTVAPIATAPLALAWNRHR